MKLPSDFKGATFDSRAVKPGMIFVALKGEKLDGRDFIPQALDKGASGIIDGLGELSAAACEYRRTLRAKVVGVTGSAGKTTTKEMLRAFLSRLGRTHATAGNFNNHIGLPMTILNTPRDADFLVLEMGTNHPGEIAALCDIAEPDSGLITSVGTAHLEFFGERAAIAREKGELLRRVREFGAAPSNCDFIDDLRRLCNADFTAAEPHPPWLAETLASTLPGAHNATNASVAFAIASRYGLTRQDAVEALRGLTLPGQRWSVTSRNSIKFINDAYNANPASMLAALDTFISTVEGKARIAVLGDMFELGEASESLHRGVGAKAGELIASGKLDTLVATGRMSCEWMADEAERTVRSAGAGPSRRIRRAADAAEAKDIIASIAHPGDAVLLKASRGMALDTAL